jgi:flagellar biosynthesis chaperone FliJ
MTIKPRVVRALRDARTRLRDVAAAEHSTSSAARDRTARELADEHDALEGALDQAAGALAAARTVHDVARVAETTGAYRIAVDEAAQRHQVAVAATETTADRLRERTRQLRTAERIVEIVDDHRARTEATAEQRGSDDLAARRR